MDSLATTRCGAGSPSFEPSSEIDLHAEELTDEELLEIERLDREFGDRLESLIINSDLRLHFPQLRPLSADEFRTVRGLCCLIQNDLQAA